jgi:hypothetical protein
VFPNFLKCLAALDTTGEKHGRLNYILIRAFLEWLRASWDHLTLNSKDIALVTLAKAAIDLLVKSVNAVEAFVKCKLNGLRSKYHFGIGLGIGGDFKCYDLKAKDISNKLSISQRNQRKERLT